MSTLAVARTSLPPGVLRLLSNPPTWRWWSSSSHPSTWRWWSPRSYLLTWRWRSPRSQGGGTRDVPFLPNFPFQILVLSTLPTFPVQYYQPVLTSTFSTSQYCQSVLTRTSTPSATRTSLPQLHLDGPVTSQYGDGGRHGATSRHGDGGRHGAEEEGQEEEKLSRNYTTLHYCTVLRIAAQTGLV